MKNIALCIGILFMYVATILDKFPVNVL